MLVIEMSNLNKNVKLVYKRMNYSYYSRPLKFLTTSKCRELECSVWDVKIMNQSFVTNCIYPREKQKSSIVQEEIWKYYVGRIIKKEVKSWQDDLTVPSFWYHLEFTARKEVLILIEETGKYYHCLNSLFIVSNDQ